MSDFEDMGCDYAEMQRIMNLSVDELMDEVMALKKQAEANKAWQAELNQSWIKSVIKPQKKSKQPSSYLASLSKAIGDITR